MRSITLTDVAEWLEDGAPHIVFSMDHYGLGSELVDYDDLPETERDKCGTVCCIAGYVYQQAVGDAAVREADWEEVACTAAHILGLPGNGNAMVHDLFDPQRAPSRCTPAQAAIAVRKVIAGEAPWK